MSDRKAELERKKLRLQQMREEKKRKEEEKRRKEAEDAAKSAGDAASDLRADAEQMLKELGIPAAGSSTIATSPGNDSREGSQESRDVTLPPQVYSSPRPKVKLSASKVSVTAIPPRELVTYSKETQTPQQTVEREALTYVDVDDDNDSLDVTVDTPPAYPVSKAHPLEGTGGQQEAEKPKEEEKPPVRELSEEEKRMIMNTESFQHFVTRATQIVERALYEKVDIFTDYTGRDDEDREGGLAEGEKLKLNRQFFDERWSRNRTVTCMDWSSTHPELLVASYNNCEEAPHEPDGVALIWNAKYKKDTPEFIFHCQSSVMSTCFAKFHPNLVVGGTYSGQIVLWDNRSSKRTPVQRTPLSAAAHTHPVYCVNVIGTQNAHNLITVSTDGKMCSWSLDMLSQPQDSMELQYKQTKSVAATAYSFISGDVNNFVVGGEDGTVYTACRHGSKAGIAEQFDGHQGPVTGIDCHNVPGPVDFSQYFLSSSFDWTVKLWSSKEGAKLLHSFEDNSDYVYDVKWSPIHPALFATVDGNGRLDLWNLNSDVEVPTASTFAEGNVALNRCRWHQAGHIIAAGDDIGKIHIYDVGEPLATPKNDEWSRFVHTLQEIKTNRAEQEEDSKHFSVGSSPLR